MSKEKQIEEMAKDICVAEQKTNYSCTEKCKKQGICAYCKVIAETLYNAGYRKQSEGEWKDGKCSGCSSKMPIKDDGKGFRWHISDYKANYCPNCGAKMKGVN